MYVVIYDSGYYGNAEADTVVFGPYERERDAHEVCAHIVTQGVERGDVFSCYVSSLVPYEAEYDNEED